MTNTKQGEQISKQNNMKKPIDIVIPLKSGSRNNYIELKYAIRSIEKNLNGVGSVFILGEKNNSFTGLKFIHCSDEEPSKFKERNIYRKILAACNHPEVSEDFVFTNDDIFLRAKFEASELPYFHKGELQTTMERNKMNNYRRSLNHSRKILLEKGLPTLDYDTHFPIIYNKQKFISTFESIDWNIEWGYVIKSLYCGLNGIEGEFGGDCKIQRKMTRAEIEDKVRGLSFFSTSDASINQDMVNFLHETYPLPSKYEK